MLLPAGFGVDTMLHELPFQCSARVFAPAVPTAQTSVPEMAATELSRLAYGSGLGLLAIDQPEDGAGVGVGVGVGEGDGRGWAATAVASVRRRAALPRRRAHRSLRRRPTPLARLWFSSAFLVPWVPPSFCRLAGLQSPRPPMGSP